MSIHRSFLFLFLCSTICFSQKHKRPETEAINRAKEFKINYPKAELVVENSYEEINFDYKKENVTVDLNLSESLINIDSKTYATRYMFYNQESEINDFEVEFVNNRSANFPIEDIAYQDKDLFYTDARVKYVKLDFPLQGFEYNIDIEKEYRDIKYFTSIYFSDEYPVKHKKIKIVVPNWLDVKFKEFNFDEYHIEKVVEKNEDNTVYIYTAIDLPARFKEEKSLGPTYVYPHIMVLPIKYTIKNVEKNIFATTADQYNWYKSLVDNLDYTKKPYAQKVKELTKGLTNKEDMIKKIFYWIQDNIRYIAFEDGIAGFQPDNSSSVYDKRYGDCKGMANLTKAMLAEIDVDARLTWIGTNHIAYDYSTPNLAVDNHMICTVLNAEGPIFLDATEKFSPYKEIANRLQGKQVLIEDGDNYILKTIPKLSAEESKEKKEYHLKIKNDNLVGSLKIEYTGESRKQILSYLNSLQSNKKEDFLKFFLEEGNSSIEAKNIQSSDIKHREGDLFFNCDLSLIGKVSSFGDKTYIDSNVTNIFSDLLLEERKSAFVFSHRKILESKVYIDITGYKVMEIPEPIHFEDKNSILDVSLAQEGNSIVFTQKIKILNEVIASKNLVTWNKKIQAVNNFINQQIILQKI